MVVRQPCAQDQARLALGSLMLALADEPLWASWTADEPRHGAHHHGPRLGEVVLVLEGVSIPDEHQPGKRRQDRRLLMVEAA